jgi:hypothetical protein
VKRYLAVLALAAMACSDSSDGSPRLRFPSTIASTQCANGKFSLTTSWQVPSGTWQAIFVSETSDETETSDADAQQTKTSTCLFPAGALVYAILFPVTVAAEADASPTITLH